MAVYNMQKPTQRPVGNPAIGYNKPSAEKPSYAAFTKPQNDMVKPGSVRPPGSYSKPIQGAEMKPPAYTNPGSPSAPSYTLPYWYRGNQTTQPIGPQMQMQATPAPQQNAGGFGYSPIGGSFGGGGSADQGRLASALQRLFGY